jgi:hypothetical protein
MDDGERAVEIERLLRELSGATARRAALSKEADEFAARIDEIRAAFGNPFFYSHPENADEGVANYTASSSGAVVLPTLMALRDVDRELAEIKATLLELGVGPD